MTTTLDLHTYKNKTPVASGTTVLAAQTAEQVLLVLHSGKIAIEHPPSATLTALMQTQQAALADKQPSLPIGFVNPQQYFGWETLMPREESLPTFRCSQPCSISVYPIKQLEDIIVTNPTVFAAIIRTMCSNLNYFIAYNNKMVALINQLAEANFKLAILYMKCDLTYDQAILKKYLRMATPDEDYLQMFKFVKAVPSFKALVHRFTLRNTSILENLYHVDVTQQLANMLKIRPLIGRISFEMILNEFTYIYRFIQKNLDLLINEFNTLAGGQGSLLKQLRAQSDKVDLERWHGLFSLAWEHYNENFFSHSFINRLFDVEKIRHSSIIQQEKLANTQLVASDEGIVQEDIDSLLSSEVAKTVTGKIFNKINPIPAKAQQLLKQPANWKEMGLKEFMSTNDMFTYHPPQLTAELEKILLSPATSDITDLRKTVRILNSIFIKGLERAAAMRYIAKKESEQAVYLLRYGVFAVRMVSKEQLAAIVAFQDNNETRYDIITMENWLERIAKEEEQPSNDLLGFNFDKFMKNKIKFLSAKARTELDERSAEEKLLSKLNFEITNMLATAYKVINFSAAATTLYTLCRFNLPESMDGTMLVTQKMIGDVVDEITSYDHLLFFREALIQVSETKNHIIEVEVLPQFIIIPAIGSNVLFWQETVGINKKTPARFIVPLLFVGNFRKSMITALGNFRWELNRTVKGVSWMNPVDGGLTGEFVDYLMFYKKDSRLSIEAKEKVSKFIRNNRNNARNMFAILYHEWIEFERKGLIRLNSEERRILFAYLPFSKKICEGLQNFPVYRDLIRRHNFKTERELARFTKYYAHLKDEDGKFPDEVEAYLSSRAL